MNQLCRHRLALLERNHEHGVQYFKDFNVVLLGLEKLYKKKM